MKFVLNKAVRQSSRYQMKSGQSAPPGSRWVDFQAHPALALFSLCCIPLHLSFTPPHVYRLLSSESLCPASNRHLPPVVHHPPPPSTAVHHCPSPSTTIHHHHTAVHHRPPPSHRHPPASARGDGSGGRRLAQRPRAPDGTINHRVSAVARDALSAPVAAAGADYGARRLTKAPRPSWARRGGQAERHRTAGDRSAGRPRAARPVSLSGRRGRA